MTASSEPRSNLRQLVRNVSTQWLGILIQAAVACAVALTFDADERAGLLGPILRRLGRA